MASKRQSFVDWLKTCYFLLDGFYVYYNQAMDRTKKIKILHAEDDVLFAKVCMAELTAAGHEVVHALDGAHALELLKGEKPHVILLDLIMPKKTGFDVLKELQESEELKSIPVVVLSNLSQQSDQEFCGAYGISKYFVKGETSIRTVVEYISNLFV